MNDKHTVHTDALKTLGNVIGADEKRDAIHIAVENTVAQTLLSPGQHIGVDGTSKNPVGIVDPFLTRCVYPGERFWLLVYPRQITSLRHVWTHPAFPDSPEVKDEPPKLEKIEEPPKLEKIEELPKMSSSEIWLRNWFETNDAPSYETAMHIFEEILSGKTEGESDNPVNKEYYHGCEWALYKSGYDDEKYIITYGTDAHAKIPAELWDHVGHVLGKPVPANLRATSFSCSC